MINIESHIEERWGALKNSLIFIACSGGLDSILLASVMHKLGFQLNVLHVNYQLRGEDSEKDALFVKNFCKEKGIVFEQNTIDLGEELKHGGNLQELARNVRYDWFKEKLSNNPHSYLAVGHHQNDQIETFFLNLSRKSGVMGLAAMLEENDTIIRPLLPFSKDELKEYAIDNGVKWREDISNTTNKYRRNFLRNRIIPLLNHQFPTLNQSVLTMVDVFQKNQKELKENIEIELKKVMSTNRLKRVIFEEWNELERIEFFRQLNQPHSKAEQLLSISEKENGKRIELNKHPDFKAIIKENDAFVFIPHKNEGFNFSLVIENRVDLPQVFSKSEIYLDQNKIVGELQLRTWENGDRIKPIGMKGSKLVSDIIKDAHVPSNEKGNVLIVHDEENVLWCVGFTIGRDAVANSKTSTIIELSLKSKK